MQQYIKVKNSLLISIGGKNWMWKSFFLHTYSPELNKIEIPWRFIKYKWIPIDTYLNFENLKDRQNETINKIGSNYNINYY